MIGIDGETKVLSKNGYISLKKVVNQASEIWDGNKWCPVIVKKIEHRRHVINVILSNGVLLKVTPDMKFMIKDTNTLLPAQFLKIGIKLKNAALPVLDGSEQFKYPYLHGAVCAFGCFSKNGPIIDLMGLPAVLVLNHKDMVILENGVKILPPDFPIHFTPPLTSSISTKLDWLSGFINTRSFMEELGIVFRHINSELIYNIQLLLSTLGIYSSIKNGIVQSIPLTELTETTHLPQFNQSYIKVNNYILLIPWCEFNKLKKLGLKSLYTDLDIPDINLEPELVVEDIIDLGEIADVYNLTEPTAIFNGILMSTI